MMGMHGRVVPTALHSAQLQLENTFLLGRTVVWKTVMLQNLQHRFICLQSDVRAAAVDMKPNRQTNSIIFRHHHIQHSKLTAHYD